MCCSLAGSCCVPECSLVVMICLCWRAGGYYSTSGADPNIILRSMEDYDGAEPAPSSIALSNLVKLASLTTGAESSQ